MILYLDCFSGISGDMTLGALIDLGVDKDLLLGELSKLGVGGYGIEIRKANKYAISGTDVIITLHDENTHEHTHPHEHPHDHVVVPPACRGGVIPPAHVNDHPHPHPHPPEHPHDHGVIPPAHVNDHPHPHDHEDAVPHGSADRSMRDIAALIENSGLHDRVKELSLRVFREIAAAEGKVHGVAPEDVHFHEIGAVDSIVDIVGVCICIWMLGIDEIYASELHEGRGFVNTRHGRLPVPVPAVLAILSGSDIPVVTEDIESELVTPTGAGFVKALAKSYGPMPRIRIEKTGYGFGKRDTGRLNALRAILGKRVNDAVTAKAGESVCDAAPTDTIILLESNIDDMTAEALGYSMECLFAAGALDVYFTPVYMKKNRPAVMLSVISRPEDARALTELIFRETTTLGVRESAIKRSVMERKAGSVDIGPAGSIRYKLAERGGATRISPEYEDCREYAKRAGIPLSDVYALVRDAYSKTSNKK